MPVIISDFKPHAWLANPHLQTVWPTLWRRRVSIPVMRERMELPDGDFVDLDWYGIGSGKPIAIFLHGLGGSIASHYAQGMMEMLYEAGWQVVFMHFRGCSGEANRLERSYHSGETGDVNFVVTQIRQRFPERVLAALGVSLGGNVLLKWLGEMGNDSLVQAAVAISVPFRLDKAAEHLSRGTSQFYQWYLLRSLRHQLRRKFTDRQCSLNLNRLSELKSFQAFDDYVTAPLHGFRDAQHYYADCSSYFYLGQIQTPTLIIHAKDDPFLPSDAIPTEQQLSPQVQLELTQRGGHVGFIGPGGRYWLEQRVPKYLAQFVK